MNRHIIITVLQVGYHKWDAAPDDVAFLRNEHRHVFHLKVSFPVTHNDRDLEFFQVQRDLRKWAKSPMNMNGKSCEMLAEDILKAFPHAAWAEVWEDGENGARVEK